MDERAERMQRHLENVYVMAKTFAALEVREPTEIADTLLSLTATLLGHEHGALFLGDADHLTIGATRGDCDENALLQAMPLWKRLAEDQFAQMLAPHECSAIAPIPLAICTHGLAAVALTVREQALGLLVVGSSGNENSFEEADLAFLSAVAGIGGLALSSGRALFAQETLARDLEQSAAAEKRHAEEKGHVIEELDRKLHIIEQQHREILTLSAPILDVGPATLAVPLIGAFDARRIDEIMGRLLTEVATRGARFVLFDMTSVEDIDVSMASHFAGLVSAVRLMGADAMVTGIRPKVARVMVDLGVDLGQIRLLPTLKQGIELSRKQPAPTKRATK